MTTNTQSLEVTRSNDITKVIYQQLMATGRTKVWSWGANSYKAILNGLTFKVQGFKLKGSVNITLDIAKDTYIIEFVRSNKVYRSVSDVFFDEMVDIIDNEIEFTGENYANDVNKAVYQFK